ncbi:hypothetical protein BGX20_006294, partial [Mortierella sp. AD010]
ILVQHKAAFSRNNRQGQNPTSTWKIGKAGVKSAWDFDRVGGNNKNNKGEG